MRKASILWSLNEKGYSDHAEGEKKFKNEHNHENWFECNEILRFGSAVLDLIATMTSNL